MARKTKEAGKSGKYKNFSWPEAVNASQKNTDSSSAVVVVFVSVKTVVAVVVVDNAVVAVVVAVVAAIQFFSYPNDFPREFASPEANKSLLGAPRAARDRRDIKDSGNGG